MNKFIGLRCTMAERAKIEALARGEGVTISEVLRELVRRAPVEERQETIVRLKANSAVDVLADRGAVA